MSRRVRRAAPIAAAPARAKSKTSRGGEGSKRPASLLGASTDDDVPSDERAKRLARRALSALHPNAVEKLEPEFGVVKKWKPSTVPDHVLLQGVRHDCQISGDGNIHNITYATDDAAFRSDISAWLCHNRLANLLRCLLRLCRWLLALASELPSYWLACV